MASVYSLQQQCTFVIWKHVGVHRLDRLDELPLPRGLQQYVLHNHNLHKYVSEAVVVRQTEYVELRKGYDMTCNRSIVYATVSMENPLFVRLSSLFYQWDRLHHARIVRCYYRLEDGERKRCLFVLDHFPTTTLDEWLGSQSRDLHQTMRVFLHVAEAVQYLHYRGIYNSQLTRANIFISPKGNAVVFLLGVAESGTWFHPPHYPHCEKVNDKADVWRLGLILYQLLFKKFEPAVVLEDTLSALSISMIHKKVDSAARTCHVSGCTAKVLKQCLSVNPTRRPTVAEVILFIRSLPVEERDVKKRYKRPASAPAAIHMTSVSVRKRPASAVALQRHSADYTNCAMVTSEQETYREENAGDSVHKEHPPRQPSMKNKYIVWPNSASFLRVSALQRVPSLPSTT
ncbi:uncharacterized protein LOC134197627 [Corticium candelabrum]|uniref:uncharacterized protein LOC134197627 n=1 Tax=Corticium candelabrum TaxID=121492 RepID=UPI002E275FB3|nr:uncharacterized protein LOC134197627 [Corticium candelabrum]